MEVLFMVAFLAVFPLSNILCFLIGARVGQKVVKGEEVELPKIDPMSAARERQERRKAEKEQEWTDAVMQNIDIYNGTAEGQKDIPVR